MKLQRGNGRNGQGKDDGRLERKLGRQRGGRKIEMERGKIKKTRKIQREEERKEDGEE